MMKTLSTATVNVNDENFSTQVLIWPAELTSLGLEGLVHVHRSYLMLAVGRLDKGYDMEMAYLLDMVTVNW
jgi:hypothetical protein